jgi:hypothetical protein
LEVHHQVRKALTSTERIEVLAAVAALDRLTAASPRLAHGVLPTVLSSLHGMDLALDAKCRLAAVLAHMRHTPELAQAAHAGGTEVCTPLQHPVRLYWAEQCEPHFVWVFWVFRRSTEGVGCARSQLLLLHPPRELAAAVLTALTRLACSSLVTVPAQVTLSLGTHATDQATPCRSGRKDIVNARPGSVGREKCAGHRFIVSISAAHSQSLSVASLSPLSFLAPSLSRTLSLSVSHSALLGLGRHPQVELLGRVATHDPRCGVRTAALQSLLLLVERTAHFAPPASLRVVYGVAAEALHETDAPPATPTLALTILHRCEPTLTPHPKQ